MARKSGDPLRGFEDFTRKVLRQWKVKGAAVAAVRGDEVVLCDGFGYRDAEQKLPVTDHTLFPLASVTKAFTTASMAALADEGALDWDTPVREYLPDFRLWDQFATERITPRDLVVHRSGLPRHDLAWYGSDASRDEIVHRLRYLQPSADFRTIFQYQNLMYMTAGYLVGRVAGSSWEEVTQQRLLDPLGMVSTSFSVKTTQHTPDHALPYSKIRNRVQRIPFYEDQDAIGPAGCLVSNVTDMTRWLMMHIGAGKVDGEQILSAAQVQTLHTPQMVMQPGKWPEMPQTSYAMGWTVQPYRGHMMLHHSGGIDGFSTLCAFLPRERAGAVVLTNMNGSPAPYILMWNLFDRFLQLDEVPWNDRFAADWKEFETAGKRSQTKQDADRVRGTRPSHPLNAYAGSYEHPGYGKIRVELEGRELLVRFNGRDYRLQHYHYDTFVAHLEMFEVTMKLQFLTNARGEIDRISAPMEPTVADIVFTRVSDEALTDPAYLQRFAGTYDLMGLPLVVTLKGSVLQLHLPGQPTYELVPAGEGEFVVKGPSGFSLEFHLDENTGAVAEAVLNQPGMTFTAPRKE